MYVLLFQTNKQTFLERMYVYQTTIKYLKKEKECHWDCSEVWGLYVQQL